MWKRIPHLMHAAARDPEERVLYNLLHWLIKTKHNPERNKVIEHN